MKLLQPVLIFAFSLALNAVPASAQSIHGWVVEDGDTVGIEGVDLVLLDSSGSAILRSQSDSVGEFRFAAPEEGAFRLAASRLGFASVEVDVDVGEKEMVEVEIRLATEAIPLEPLVVVGRREIRPGTLDEFYDRMGRNRERGVGWFFTREEIEAKEDMRLSLLLHSAPGVFRAGSGESVLMRERGEWCTPVVYVDGLETNYRELQLMDMEGVEVYKGWAENVPGYFPSDCGMIFLWRRPNWGNPFSWGKAIVTGGLLAVLAAIAALM